MTLAVDLDLGRRFPQLQAPRRFAWSEQPVVVLDQGVPWLYGPVERDPLMSARGRVALPRREIKRLRALAALDVPFQRLAIAHELDPDGPAADIVPMLGDGPRTGPMPWLARWSDRARRPVGAPGHSDLRRGGSP